MLKKLLLFCSAALTITNASSVLLCENKYPTACQSYSTDRPNNYGITYNCTGGTLGITQFEMTSACSTNPGIGDYANPVKQQPSGLVPSSGAAQSQIHCYCQIRKINGSAVSASTWWVFHDDPSVACNPFCASNCPARAIYDKFRNALFSAAGY